MMTSSNGNFFRVTGPFFHKGRWLGALMFSLICTWTNSWANYRAAGDLRRHRAHYDVIVMESCFENGSSNWNQNKNKICICASVSVTYCNWFWFHAKWFSCPIFWLPWLLSSCSKTCQCLVSRNPEPHLNKKTVVPSMGLPMKKIMIRRHLYI